MSLGMHLKKIQWPLKFHQKPWMKSYNEMNTELQKKTTNDFKDLYKLMSNTVYEKAIKNLCKQVNAKLASANEEDKLRCLITSPASAQANIFIDDLAAIQVRKSLVGASLTSPNTSCTTSIITS